jgi:hypothetical protein
MHDGGGPIIIYPWLRWRETLPNKKGPEASPVREKCFFGIHAIMVRCNPPSISGGFSASEGAQAPVFRMVCADPDAA